MNDPDIEKSLWRIIGARDVSLARLEAHIQLLDRSLIEKEQVIRELKLVCDEREVLIKRLSR